MTLTADFAAVPGSRHAAEIERLCDAMEAAGKAGCYPRLTVERPWSAHNPVLEGEFAAPRAIRWYLERELGRLAASGARISVCPGREALDLHDPGLGPANRSTSTPVTRWSWHWHLCPWRARNAPHDHTGRRQGVFPASETNSTAGKPDAVQARGR
jgi:hypothetical protein